MSKPGSFDGAADPEGATPAKLDFAAGGVIPAAGGACEMADETARLEVTIVEGGAPVSEAVMVTKTVSVTVTTFPLSGGLDGAAPGR